MLLLLLLTGIFVIHSCAHCVMAARTAFLQFFKKIRKRLKSLERFFFILYSFDILEKTNDRMLHHKFVQTPREGQGRRLYCGQETMMSVGCLVGFFHHLQPLNEFDPLMMQRNERIKLSLAAA